MNFSSEWLANYEARNTPKTRLPAPEADAGPESGLHAKIIAECKRRGWIYFHGSMAHRAMRVAGEPDFQILADHGRVFLIEVKSREGKLTPAQLGLKLWAEKLGHTVHVVRSFKEFLDIISAGSLPADTHPACPDTSPAAQTCPALSA